MTTKIIDRQHAFVGLTPLLGIANIGASNGVEFKIRPGTLLLNVFSQTNVGFDALGVTLTVTDSAIIFIAAEDVTVPGTGTVANVPKYYPTGGLISVSVEQSGAGTATVGELLVGFEYVIVGNGNAGIEE